MLKKLPLIIPLLALIALLVWWFTPRYSEEEMAGTVRFSVSSTTGIAGVSSRYGKYCRRRQCRLRAAQNHYIPALGERMRQTWLQLSQQEQESIGQDQPRAAS